MSVLPSSAAPHDAADWAHTPERSNAFALRLMTGLALRCGRPLARALLVPITLYFLLFAPGPRRQSRRYLARVLGRPARLGDVYRHLLCFATVLLDRVYLLAGRSALFEVTQHGEALVDEALAEGQGAFLVGAHLGSFEALGVVGRERAGLRVAMVMYPDNAHLVNDALAAVAADRRPHVIALGRPDAMLAIRDWLDGGGLAGMLADRTLPDAGSARTGSLRLPFLGREAAFNDGPFRLAALLRRRVVFMAGLYLGGNRYEVHFEPLADFRERAGDAAERERRIEAALRAYAAQLEALCRAHPYNWFNFHDFWRDDDAA